MIPYLSLADGSEVVELHFDYDQAFIKEFKAAIPYPALTWNKDRKCWMVHIDCAAEARDIVTKRFGKVSMNKGLQERLKGKEKDEGPMDPDTCGWLF